MSLVNDALKRARVEALRQEATRDGLDYRAVPAHSRRAPRSAVHIAGWVVAAVALGAVGWLLLRSPTTGGPPLKSPLPVAGSPSAPAAVEAVETVAAEVPSDRGPTIEADRETSPAGPSATTPQPETPAQISPAERSGDGSTPSSRVVATTGVAREAPSTRLQAGATYLRRAMAADGSMIELAGIAYSEDRPIAVINGSVVAPGDMIAGYTIVAIEPERVELEADGVRVYLSLH